MISGPDVVDAPPPRRRPRRRLLLVAVGVVLAALALTATIVTVQGSSDTSPVVRYGDGKRAPTFRLPDLRDPGRSIDLADFAGRPVVLSFWASWCVPCRREMPAFEQLHRQLGDAIAFVGVNHQDGRAPALDLLDESGVTYPSGRDPAGEVARAYGLIGMPTTVLISAAGERVATRTGELRADELERLIRELLLGG